MTHPSPIGTDVHGERIVVVGAGGHGREVVDIVRSAFGGSACAGIVDDGEVDHELLQAMGLTHLGVVTASHGTALSYVIGIGSGQVRNQVAEMLAGRRFAAPAVHRAASIGSLVRIGEGSTIAAGARVTTNVTIGRHCYIGPNAVVSHDCVLEDFATVLPGAMVAGSVHIGQRATLGIGAVTRQNLTIGADALLGAGAVAVADVAACAVVAGVPARPLPARR